MTNPIKQAQILSLIEVLSDGEFHSGEVLSKQFSLSRMAIHNKIAQLKEYGLLIEAKKHVGYRIKNKIQRLDFEKINNALQGFAATPLQLFFSIDSTNAALLRQIEQLPKGQTFIAEHQTQGRGLQGRSWFSPLGCNLYLSIYWPFEKGFGALNGLSLAIGIALCDALCSLTKQSIQIKWPNDLYLNQKKIGGILVELAGKINDTAHAVIGFGLNLNMPKSSEFPIDQHYESLLYHDKNQLAAFLVRTFYRALAQFEASGFSGFYPLWSRYDLYFNQPIAFCVNGQQKIGIERGIDQQGALLIEDDQNQLQSYASGEIQLKKPIALSTK